ncbi:uncharacterized protein LMH87_008201 [Akanthomyces muscarius]|uniref:Uncharacterized protein n=1 Tax=Akanthomyces muscarius TaxID=2231603 RepID=A0A9W8QI91_AKAMU|nr:uncharacterized protein LMH87_008201 [Akanthomyces muscarius]KAJ4159294.1 hypothetical protein LMH87_008201 [Akanthomyces muscarius]
MMVGSTGKHELCWTRQLFLGGLLATGVFKRTAKTNALWRYWKRRIEVGVGVGIWRGEFLFTDPLPSINLQLAARFSRFDCEGRFAS